MNKYLPFVVAFALLLLAGIAAYAGVAGHPIALLAPKGVIAERESALIGTVVLIMLIVALAVFALAVFFAWRYRARNTAGAYAPEWEHGALSEFVWWAIPFEIVLVLGALTWSSTHELDPHRALASSAPTETIEVVALPSKWLFLYPAEGVASAGVLHIPAGRPVRFFITADAPMNSFWIPELGGQIYAMTGMVTELNLMADAPGTYRGGSANYSGDGFAAMSFDAIAASEAEFDSWVGEVKASSAPLSIAGYNALTDPAPLAAPAAYSAFPAALFSELLEKFDGPPGVTGYHH